MSKEQPKRSTGGLVVLCMFLFALWMGSSGLQAAKDTKPVEAAKTSCRNAVMELEEFPSTVSYDLFGTSAEVDSVVGQFTTVHVNYTVTNSSGARLPYRLSCVVDHDGNITYHYRGGR